MAEWDPIGVNDTPEAADEYDGYIGPLLDLLNARASSDEVAQYLRTVEIERMGLGDAQGKPLLPVQQRNAAVHPKTTDASWIDADEGRIAKRLPALEAICKKHLTRVRQDTTASRGGFMYGVRI